MKAKINNGKVINCSICQNKKISGTVNNSNAFCADVANSENINANSTQRGPQGIPGEAATIQLGTVTTGAAGSDVIITNSGTENAAIFNFTIPRGDRGEQGEQGIQGKTGNGIASVELTSTSGLVDTYTIIFTNGNTTTFNVTNGQDGNGIASIQKTSTSGLVDTYTITFDNGNTETFTVTNGQKGDTGSAATISVGSITTGAAGTSASVTNSGTSSAAVLDFVIPQGVKGDTGATGADGFSPTATVTKSGDTATITITDKNGTTTATVSDGSGASSISQLTDVDLTGLSNGDVLVYDSTSQEWKAEAQSGGVTDVEVNGESVVTSGVAEIDLTGYQPKLTAGTDLEIISGGSVLPTGYTPLTYIQSSGTQYIDTNYSARNGARLEIDFQYTSFTSMAYTLGFSDYNGSLLFVRNSGVYTINSSQNINFSANIYNKNHISITFTTTNSYPSMTVTIGEETKTFARNNAGGSPLTLQIFCAGSQTNYCSTGKCYGAKLYNSNNSLVMDLVPAKRYADGKVGMFDLVGNNFIAPSGTGNFIAGEIQTTTTTTTTTINFTNESGYIKGINSSDVITALGYTPYNASNPDGYTSNVGTVTSVNGTQPDGNGNVAITIPAVNNGTLTITQDGNTLGTFGANQSGNTTVDIPPSSNRNVGEIVTSTIPLTDAGLHLLDGSLISGSGSYSAFVDYIAGLVTDYPDLFDTEANWQSAVTQYGICGKFVYDSVNNTVRLPKLGNQIITENSDIAHTAADSYYYISAANSDKTQIQVDIDNIATDLNGKADNDLSNLTATSSTNLDGQWVYSFSQLASSVALSTSTDQTYSLSTYLPNDGHNYEVLIGANISIATVSKFCNIYATTDLITSSVGIVGGSKSGSNYNFYNCGSVVVPVGSGRSITVLKGSSSSAEGTYSLNVYGYRRIGTNQ